NVSCRSTTTSTASAIPRVEKRRENAGGSLPSALRASAADAAVGSSGSTSTVSGPVTCETPLSVVRDATAAACDEGVTRGNGNDSTARYHVSTRAITGHLTRLALDGEGCAHVRDECRRRAP